MNGWSIEKDVLYPGRVVVSGPNGKPVSYTFTPHDVHAIANTCNAKIRDAWNIPLVWEHQDESPERRKMLQLSQAERQREFARGVFGCSTRFVVRDGRLRAVLEGDDPADLKQFAKVKFVSPEVQWDWRDTDGKVWHGPTITHIAATPRPVQRHQQALQLSQTAHDLRDFGRFHEFLAAVQNPTRVGVTMHPLSIRLSLTDWEKPMADELENGAPAGGNGGKGSAWERIAVALGGCGIKIGDGKGVKDADHLADLIEVATMNSEHAEPDLDEEATPDDEGGDQDQGGDLDQPPAGSVAPGQPMQMSLEAAKAANDTLTRKVIDGAREGLVARARRVAKSGALAPADGDALVQRMQTIRLSLNAKTGDLERNDAIVELEALERVKPGTTWSPRSKKVRMSHTRPVDDSPYRDKPNSPKEDDEFVALFEESVGRGSKK